MVGIGYQHPTGFTIDRPKGFDSDVFAHFLVPVRIRTADGLQKAPAHACIIYTSDHPQWFTGDGVGLENHWIHAWGSYFRQMLRCHHIPLNRVIRPGRTDFIPSLLVEIRNELNRTDIHTGRQVEILLERLCIGLSRELNDQGQPGLTSRQHELREAFQKMRESIHNRPQEEWSVERMAEQVHLSPSRLSPLERAKWLLSSSTAKIAQIAELSGFASIYHFSRLFRRKVGCTPTAYARR